MSRKIEADMISAIFAKKDFTRDNTQVRFDGNNWRVILHNTAIAQCENGILRLATGGWKTTTTKSRLNAILRHFGKGGIFQKDGTWYWTYSGRGETVEFFDGMQCEI